MLQRNFKLCDFPVHSVCFLRNFFFRSEQKFLFVLYHCAKFYKFSLSTFKDIFDRNINFAKFSRVTRSLNLHLREPGVLAQACAISGPGRARQETISSHLKCQFFLTNNFFLLYLYSIHVYRYIFFRQSTLKDPRPVVLVVWPHCINLSYMYCFLYSGSSHVQVL